MDYLEGLNNKQREAVETTEGPLLILAGAGSGKTRVVTHKIAYLIESLGVSPINILAITFTNKAASEMKERVAKLLNRDVDYMWMGTFHSICVRILRKHIEKIGYTSSFTIYDRADQITLVKECLRERNLSREYYNENAVLSFIGNQKDKMISPEAYINNNYKDLVQRTYGELYQMYQAKLLEYNALDFDDLIIKTVELLNNNEEVLREYQERFKYVFVDEYQDTNGVQYKLIKLLSGGYNNLSVVGDADQSIYGWRGADIRNILDFEKDYKGARTILLEQNYRSTNNILSLANHVIKNNTGRKKKNLWTSSDSGESVKYYTLDNEREEAKFAANTIYKMLGEGKKLSDFAVLYRTNAQSRPFEEIFMQASLPYKVVGGLKFYDRMEIKDLVAYLRIVENPVDNISMKRIINTPKRGIGDATVEKLSDFAERINGSLYDALEALSMLEIGRRPRKKLEDFKGLIDSLIDGKESRSLSEFIEFVASESGYIEDLERQNNIEAQTRIDNIKEFLSGAVNYERENQEVSLEDFLANVSLLSDVDKTEDSNNAITLMTLHSAKGLEFPVVFMVGMEENLFPGFRAIDSGDDEEMEEERRLCYVGITRAEQELFITNARQRMIYGMTKFHRPSRFIEEMEDFIEVVDLREKKPSVHKPLKSTPRTSLGLNNKYSMTNNNRKSPTNRLGDREKISKNKYKDGDKVKHGKWGIGVVVSAKDRSDGDQELTIAFEEKGVKLLLASLAPISLV